MSAQTSPRESAPQPTTTTSTATVVVFASPRSWIESDALAQCHQVATLDGMVHVAAMPDLHPGKGAPIGAAMLSTVLYPFLVGSDIGCGIAVFPIKLKRVVPEKLAARFPDLDQPLDPERDADDPAWATVAGTSLPLTSRASGPSAAATTSSNWRGSTPSSSRATWTASDWPPATWSSSCTAGPEVSANASCGRTRRCTARARLRTRTPTSPRTTPPYAGDRSTDD